MNAGRKRRRNKKELRKVLTMHSDSTWKQGKPAKTEFSLKGKCWSLKSLCKLKLAVVSCATNYSTLVTCLRHLAIVSSSF